MNKNTKRFFSMLVFSFMVVGISAVAYAAEEKTDQVQLEEVLTSPINLNKASKEELLMIKGVGPVLAERILAYRHEIGAFQTIEEVMGVNGIGEGKFEKIKSFLKV